VEWEGENIMRPSRRGRSRGGGAGGRKISGGQVGGVDDDLYNLEI
jgi:hypothetical protein